MASRGDLHYDNIITLLHMDGTDGSTTFVDNGPEAYPSAAENGAEIDTTEKVFGSASYLGNGVQSNVRIGDNPTFLMATNNFTIEGFIRFASSPTGKDMALASHWRDLTGRRQWWVGHNSSNEISFNYSTTGTDEKVFSAPWTTAIDTDYFIVVERQGANLYISIDGVQVTGSPFDIATDSIHNSEAEHLRMGGGHIGSNIGLNLDGWIDEFRWTIGVGRYGANPVIPNQAFPNNGILPRAMMFNSM